jgi:hypothetical protein
MKLVEAGVAAPVIGRRESWLRWAAQHGLVPHYKISRSLRFSIEELEDWCRRQRVPAADERDSVPAGSAPAQSERSRKRRSA